MKAYVIIESEDFCTGAYYFGRNKYEFYFKSKDNAEVFANNLKKESDNEIAFIAVDVEDSNDIQWMD